MLIRAVDHKEKKMNNILNLDQYVKDFEEIVLPEFKSKAEEMLYDSIDTCDPGANLEVNVEAFMCRDQMDHFFRFYEQPDVENVEETGEILISYGGCN